MMVDLKARGYKVFAVGKVYDNELYAQVYGGGRDAEYDGMSVKVFKAYDLDSFERELLYEQSERVYSMEGLKRLQEFQARLSHP